MKILAILLHFSFCQKQLLRVGAILRAKGYMIKYQIEEDSDGNPITAIYVEHEKDGKKQIDILKDFLNSQEDKP